GILTIDLSNGEHFQTEFKNNLLKIKEKSTSDSSFFNMDLPLSSENNLLGEGTKENPYLISNASELNLIREDLTAYYKLTNDID
ncbi:hypothetical protein KXT90_25105, partial [Salmonella enterica subsp. enterica serovar Weltevreden]|nr:hypothetical protein [Salmonella enterica subsp. enterica serovar Weltevreden]MCH5988349.1 hypothetical protein [Salmonella enterica]